MTSQFVAIGYTCVVVMLDPLQRRVGTTTSQIPGSNKWQSVHEVGGIVTCKNA